MVDLHMSPGLQRAFLVVDGDALVGIVTVSDVAKMAAEARGWRQVSEVMTPARELDAVSAFDPLERALELMLRGGHPQLPLMEDGRPVGMIWREDVVQVLELASVVGTRGGRPTG